MSKVNIHGKERSLLEARLLLLELEIGLISVNLNEEEKREYFKWEAIRKSRNEISRKNTGEARYKKINERKYLIENLGNKITSAKKKEPEKKGYESSFNPFSG